MIPSRRLRAALAAAPLAALVLAFGAPPAAAQGVCEFDEVALRLPAEDVHDWQEGHHDPVETEGFRFTIALFAMHSGGARMDAPVVEGVKRYAGVSKQTDLRFVWNGHVFAMPRGDGLGLADGRRVLVVRRADAPVVDVMLGRCSEEGFKGGAFATEFFDALRAEDAEAQ